MSNTIDARYYNAQLASVLQRRPSTIINAAESVHQVESMQFYGCGVSAGSSTYRLGTKQTGTRRTLLFVNKAVRLETSAIRTEAVEDFNMDSWVRWSETSKLALCKASTAAKAAPSAAAKIRVNRLAELQAALGLSISDLAHALALSRPGLYKWLDISSDVKLQGASRERLAAIERIAKQWRERSTAPLSTVVHEPLADGQTIFSLMAAEEVNEDVVICAYDQLIAKLAGRPKSRSQKLADAGFKRRPSANSLPADE